MSIRIPSDESGAAMQVYDVAGQVTDSGEYILGADATGSHACYLIYGVLAAGEAGRELRPGPGHEETVLCVRGSMRLTGSHKGTVDAGQAIHLREDESCLVSNPGTVEVVYVIAGGHTGNAHRH
jgi:hypothetical protein